MKLLLGFRERLADLRLHANHFLFRQLFINEDPSAVLINDDAFPLGDVDLALWRDFDV